MKAVQRWGDYGEEASCTPVGLCDEGANFDWRMGCAKVCARQHRHSFSSTHIAPQDKEQKRNKKKELKRQRNPKSTLQELLRINLPAPWNKNEFCFPKLLIGYIKTQHTFKILRERH